MDDGYIDTQIHRYIVAPAKSGSLRLHALHVGVMPLTSGALGAAGC